MRVAGIDDAALVLELREPEVAHRLAALHKVPNEGGHGRMHRHLGDRQCVGCFPTIQHRLRRQDGGRSGEAQEGEESASVFHLAGPGSFASVFAASFLSLTSHLSRTRWPLSTLPSPIRETSAGSMTNSPPLALIGTAGPAPRAAPPCFCLGSAGFCADMPCG